MPVVQPRLQLCEHHVLVAICAPSMLEQGTQAFIPLSAVRTLEGQVIFLQIAVILCQKLFAVALVKVVLLLVAHRRTAIEVCDCDATIALIPL